MLKTRLVIIPLVVFVFGACVKPKIYRAELATRQAAEAREKVLVQELLDRKRETADLTKQVGDLNRLIGNQEEEIKDLNAELKTRTQKMGESSSKLASEKTALENELAAANNDLARCNAKVQRDQNVRYEREKIRNDLKKALVAKYADQQGVVIAINSESVALTLPDKNLFDAKGGIEISAAGKSLLTPLAQYLVTRPELDVEIVCYTDNALPKDKTLQDTWDWSLRRATNLTRLLIREFNVNANQLTPVGRGEFYPLASNETAEGREKNRRTVIVFHPVLPALPAEE